MSCKSNVDGVYEHIKNGQNAMLNFPTDEVESCSSSSNESTWLFSICRKNQIPCAWVNSPFLDTWG